MQEIEIERKTMLTEDEFHTLEQALPFPNEPISQTNYYFETRNLALKEKHAALRIRKIANQYTLTLKEPHPVGILETHDSLTKKQWNEWINGEAYRANNVLKRLERMNIHVRDLQFLGSLTTERRTYTNGNVSYMLDKSYYFDQVDYELEVEASSETDANEALHTLLHKHHIEEKHADPKIKRFYIALQKQK